MTAGKVLEIVPAAWRSKEALEPWLALIPAFPFVGFLINGLFGRRLDKRFSGVLATLAAFASFVFAFLCVAALFTSPAIDGHRHALYANYGTWMNATFFNCSFGLLIDPLSAVMILIVTGIGTLIHLYSAGYMHDDPSLWRFFTYLNLFLFAMILLVLGDNLMLLFVGWEGVGLCSYLLIGFWFEDPKNAAAGMKAFVVNRIGDLGFILGMFTLIAMFGTVTYYAKPNVKNDIPAPQIGATATLPLNPGLLDYTESLRASGGNVGNFDFSKSQAARIFTDWPIAEIITLCCILLFIGAMGKSAQIPLYVWLPDAMAGPTPVSALIHAATMVTAGIYMVCRLHSLFAMSETAMTFVACIGGATALFSALIGLTQLDIKKVLAYSTVSQLGYMFLALGAGVFSLGIFHVMTHAFFKALLFLGAGSVIHAMSGEQDMRYMGGLRTKLPITFWTMLIGSLALAGFPLTAGWYSKDEILGSVLARYEDSHKTIYLVLYAAGIAGAFCTAFYTFRLIGLTFFAQNRAKEEVQHHIHESPPSMTIPLIVLAVLSLIGGVAWHHFFDIKEAVHGAGILNVPLSDHAVHHAHTINMVATLIAAIGGIALGLALYAKGERIPHPEGPHSPLYRLSLNKFYVDEIYNALIVLPFIIGSEIIHWVVEVLIIDTLITGSAYLVSYFAGIFRRVQTGVLNTYAFGLLAGTVAVLLYLFVTKG